MYVMLKRESHNLKIVSSVVYSRWLICIIQYVSYKFHICLAEAAYVIVTSKDAKHHSVSNETIIFNFCIVDRIHAMRRAEI